MKARTITTRKEITKEVELEFESQYESLYRKAADDLITQFAAMYFWTMATRYGWGKKRLQDLVAALKDTDQMMCNPSRLHGRFTALDCEKHIKNKYGIDLRKEFKATVEVKP